MRTWRRSVSALSREEISRAVNNDAWQRFRLSLKGLSTRDKLYHLEGYLSRREKEDRLTRDDVVRVDNYINALLRGGQLVHAESGGLMVRR